jgi:thioredoxin 1
MTDISKLDEATFQNEVIESAEPVLVDFTAVWCQPCKMLDPVVEELANDWEDTVRVFKLDVDEHPNVAMNYQIMGVPTLMLFKDGKPVERVTGYQPKDRIEKKFNPHIQLPEGG